jgi:hypothetical protein
LQETECLEEEEKVSSWLWFGASPLELVPLQSFQDHHDGDIEASGVAMLSSFHQAVPGSFQVVVPVRNI